MNTLVEDSDTVCRLDSFSIISCGDGENYIVKLGPVMQTIHITQLQHMTDLATADSWEYET
jgi:hypothetical protein